MGLQGRPVDLDSTAFVDTDVRRPMREIRGSGVGVAPKMPMGNSKADSQGSMILTKCRKWGLGPQTNLPHLFVWSLVFK